MFVVGEKIGAGQFGCVHRGRHKHTGEEVAIKRFATSTLQEYNNVLREIEVMESLDHPNIVRYIATQQVPWPVLRRLRHFVQDLSRCFGPALPRSPVKEVQLVMQFGCGGELLSGLRHRGMNEKTVRDVVRQLLSALDYMHVHNFVHRDLKPENVVFANPPPDTRVLIVDLGSARRQATKREAFTTICGTPLYLAPEIIRCARDKDASYDNQSDMWSLGVVTYLLLSGTFPFRTDSLSKMAREILDARYEFPMRYWDNVSPHAIDFVRKCMERDPRRRLVPKIALCHPWLSGVGVDSIQEGDEPGGACVQRARAGGPAIGAKAPASVLEEDEEEGAGEGEEGEGKNKAKTGPELSTGAKAEAAAGASEGPVKPQDQGAAMPAPPASVSSQARKRSAEVGSSGGGGAGAVRDGGEGVVGAMDEWRRRSSGNSARSRSPSRSLSVPSRGSIGEERDRCPTPPLVRFERAQRVSLAASLAPPRLHAISERASLFLPVKGERDSLGLPIKGERDPLGLPVKGPGLGLPAAGDRNSLGLPTKGDYVQLEDDDRAKNIASKLRQKVAEWDDSGSDFASSESLNVLPAVLKPRKPSRENTLGENETVEHEGWLNKVGNRRKSVRRRWFVLVKHQLFYFRVAFPDLRTERPMGTFNLADLDIKEGGNNKHGWAIKMTPCSDGGAVVSRRHSRGYSRSQLFTINRDVLVLYADTKLDRDEWIAVLSPAVVRL